MKLLVAVPVFNERQYVQRVLAEIRHYADDVLVVDDGSTDGTSAVLRRMARHGRIALLEHPENRGYGQSLIDAFTYASAHGYDWVLTMDCDEQHEPSRIPAFVAAARHDDADVLSGSRYLSDEPGDMPPPDRRSINCTITDLINSTLKLNLTDSFCGFKAHRVVAMDKLDLTIPGYAFPMQFWVQAAAAGLRVREIPVKLIYKDATRHFGGALDDPTARLAHYLEVFVAELKRGLVAKAAAEPVGSMNAAAAQDCACCCD